MSHRRVTLRSSFSKRLLWTLTSPLRGQGLSQPSHLGIYSVADAVWKAESESFGEGVRDGRGELNWDLDRK